MANTSLCVFIRNNNAGGFCLWETLHQLLPIVDDVFILDLGSTDDTYDILKRLATKNHKIRIAQDEWPKLDAGAFATLANTVIDQAKYDRVIYVQADEVFHDNLVTRLKDQLMAGLHWGSFWRIQFKYNMQQLDWAPHVVHRLGIKNEPEFTFIADGMNTGSYMSQQMISDYGTEYFTRWGQMDPMTYPVNQMITDVSSMGLCLETLMTKKGLHAPFWNETDHPVMEGKPLRDWYNKQVSSDDWFETQSPFDIPTVLHRHLGRQFYEIDEKLLSQLEVL